MLASAGSSLRLLQLPGALICLNLVQFSGGQEPAKSPSPDEWFPDHDCGRTEGSMWQTWLQAFESRPGGGFHLWFPDSMHILNSLTTDDARAKAVAECPVGLLMADVLLALACYDHEGDAEDGCYRKFEFLARAGLVAIGLRVLIGSRWPVYDTLNANAWNKHEVLIEEGRPEGPTVASAAAAYAQKDHLDCERIENPILDWTRFKRLFGDPEWYQAAVDVAYGPELEKDWRGAAVECPLGFAVANVIKAMLCAHTESVCFRAHAQMIGQLLSETPLHLVVGSGWPIFSLLGHVARVVRRHRFELDFAPDELIRPAAAAAQLSAGVARTSSLAMQDLQKEMPKLLKLPETQESQGLRLVYASMVYGPRFNPYVGRFISRAKAVGVEALVMFCLDEEAFAACRDADGLCVRGTPSILNKFTLPLMLLKHGLDVFWIDLDVFLFQSPTPFVRRQVELGDYELLVSGSFAVDCVCSGIVFFRACERTRTWLTNLLSWMYEHPYEHDQKAFNAFLRAGERVAFDHELPVAAEDMPRWAFLDPETEFVSARHVDVAGWYGDADRIVAFHMLHGDSDATEASKQFAARFNLGVGYMPLLDLFFNQTDLPELYTTGVLPHHMSPILKEALWLSRWPTPRPENPTRCNETVPMNF
eukprot:TRINITY_DN59660_c0_g1_i1.p1 TRINITY_DN59660_c0_g1~~TRINITY_DN59660_c0_g1_i1.p1  ORF type:complete len:647 (-),score=128.63 TRINITY_DN59660_c0_g1_i1:7-1947(-)